MAISHGYEEQYLRINEINWASGSVANIATDLSTILAKMDNQQLVVITNTDSTSDVYIGFDNTVSSTKYVAKLTPGQTFSLQAGKSVDLWGISSGVSTTVTITRMA